MDTIKHTVRDRVSPEEEARIVEAARAGARKSELVKQFGRTWPTINRVLSSAGLANRTARKTRSPEAQEAAPDQEAWVHRLLAQLRSHGVVSFQADLTSNQVKLTRSTTQEFTFKG